jgi:hypothetical protein
MTPANESLEHQAELFQELCDGTLDPHTVAEIILIIHKRLGRLEARAREAGLKAENDSLVEQFRGQQVSFEWPTCSPLHNMTDEQVVMDLKAENDNLIEQFRSIRETCYAKDTEIERQGKANDILSDLLYKMEAKANRHEALITELADALQAKTSCVEYNDIALIQRAREATKP